MPKKSLSPSLLTSSLEEDRQKLYFGVDPGASGGLACLFPTDRVSCRVHAEKMPPTRQEVIDWFVGIRELIPDSVCFAVVEKVGGYVSSGGGASQAGQPGSAMFKFGQQYERVLMALHVLGIPCDELMPNVWQRAIGVTPRGKGEAKGSYKNRLKARASQLFPTEKVTLATADALLLAELARRRAEGRL